tara:strand:+ start:536 stop:748 length:213 start_codon:yes stop_codon:yes gene_type:complete
MVYRQHEQECTSRAVLGGFRRRSVSRNWDTQAPAMLKQNQYLGINDGRNGAGLIAVRNWAGIAPENAARR